MPSAVRHFYEFGEFRLDAKKHRLLRHGEVVPLSPKSIEALLLLVQNPGKPLEREALMQAVWADTFVEDANLTVAISHLRKALGQNGETAEYIETVPRVGYRFVADVREIREQPAPLIVEKHTLSRTVIEEEVISDDPRSEEKTEAIAVPFAATKRTSLVMSRNATVSLISVAALFALGLGTLLYVKSGERKTNEPARVVPISIKSLAVLPPQPLSGEAENPSLSLGMADALITRLGGIQRVVVRPTSSIVRYVDNNQDPVGAGRALGVDAVIEGTLQRDSGRTRVSLRLRNVANGSQLWAGNFEEANADIFKLQDSISEQVAEALLPDLSQRDRALLHKQRTTNPEAYALYLKGNYFWGKRGDEATKSVDYFRKAIELDPNFAEAYVALAAKDATNWNPSAEAEMLIDKALQLDPNLAEAHATLGFIHMFHHWDWPAAETELDRAIELDPYSATAHHWKGVYLSLRGRLDEAKAEMHRALELDPLSLIIMADIGQVHYFAHEYDQAIDYCNRALALDSDFYTAHEYLIDIYLMKGIDQEVLNELFKLDYRESPLQEKQRVRDIFSRGGVRAVFADQIASRQKHDSGAVNALIIGRLYCRLGDKGPALFWLDRAMSGPRHFAQPYLNVDPLYDNLRSDPRFKEILHHMNLP